MSRLYREHFGEARQKLAFNALYRPRAAADVVPDHAALYRRAAEVVGRHEPVTYLEFGVADGGSLRAICREFTHRDAVFIGFDSFTGLPEDWVTLNRGAFALDGTPPRLDDARVRFVPGWFQDTFHESLRWLAPLLTRRVLVHFDADLYASTLFLLTSLWPHCRDYHFIMDDFMVDDIVALHDFSLAFPVDITFLARREGGIPHSVLGRMTRAPFRIADSAQSAAELQDQAETLARDGQIESALRLWTAARESRDAGVRAWLAPALRLRDERRFADAETLLAEALTRFPRDPDCVMAWAETAGLRNDWPEALRRWTVARDQWPDHLAPYDGVSAALRALGRADEAAALRAEAHRRFPAPAQGATPPAPSPAYAEVAKADALLARGELDEACRILVAATSRFPNDAAPWRRLAGLSAALRNWSDAEACWRRVVTLAGRGPSDSTELAAALREQKRWPDAEAVLARAKDDFPGEIAPHADHAWLAAAQGDWPEASRRLRDVRARFPHDPIGFVRGGVAARELGRLDEAEALLSEAARRFPANRGALTEYAGLAEALSDWPEALRRWEKSRRAAADDASGHCGAARALIALGRLSEADALLTEAIARIPNAPRLRIEFARLAEARRDWTEALRLWRELTARFPDQPEGPCGEAAMLRRLHQTQAADLVLKKAMARLPHEVLFAVEYARDAMERNDWTEAARRLLEARGRFPDYTPLRRLLFEAQLRLADAGEAPAPMPDPANAVNDEARDLVMSFESLGGGGHGCEFGIFQRAFGAEPLGLLRWADIYQDELCAALDNSFAGVGEAEFTQVFVPEGKREYWTRDTRYHMAMCSFVNSDEVTAERMSAALIRRTRFLRARLLDDLREGSKIFVYKNMKRDLTDGELGRLHAAVRRHGDNTLFYIRYQDAEHPAGTVTWRGTGLLVGYIDHFSHTPDTDRFIGFAHERLLALCRQAHALRRARQPKI